VARIGLSPDIAVPLFGFAGSIGAARAARVAHSGRVF